MRAGIIIDVHHPAYGQTLHCLPRRTTGKQGRFFAKKYGKDKYIEDHRLIRHNGLSSPKPPIWKGKTDGQTRVYRQIGWNSRT
jgi:hypothetical protein